jgi:hypothetical protein
MTERLWFLNALGFAALPFTSISSLWVPLAFDQGMNVIQFWTFCARVNFLQLGGQKPPKQTIFICFIHLLWPKI